MNRDEMLERFGGTSNPASALVRSHPETIARGLAACLAQESLPTDIREVYVADDVLLAAYNATAPDASGVMGERP